MNKLDTKRYSCDAPEPAMERDVQVSFPPQHSSEMFGMGYLGRKDQCGVRLSIIIIIITIISIIIIMTIMTKIMISH